MAPVTLERFVQELERLKKEMDAGRLQHGEYDQRLARMIGELRERKIEGDRGTVAAMLDGLLKRGVITPAVRTHILTRLGIT
ncbi:MAG TPA: hypothetical protein VFH97_08930 [Gemmatimonadales bacterium]|nr:hypothetical protein [Gemmatimonadales bacterium]